MPAALYWNKDIVLSHKMTDTISLTLDVQISGVLMFERNLFKMNKNVLPTNGYLTKKLHRANRHLRSPAGCVRTAITSCSAAAEAETLTRGT